MLSEYREQAMAFAVFEDDSYPILALSEEVGEFHGKLAKAARGDEKYEDKDVLKEDCILELGDVLWQLTACCGVIDTTLEEVARRNLEKLTDRAERGKIKGDGDDR